MKTGHIVVLLGALLLPLGCTRTVVVRTPAPAPAPPPPTARAPEPIRERERLPRPATAAALGIPPGHLPREGECRIWIPGVPPGRQGTDRSRSCVGIGRAAPAGSWIVYRPTHDLKRVHVRVVSQRQAGMIDVVRIFEFESGRYLWEEGPDYDAQYDRADDDRDRRDRRDDRDRDRDDRDRDRDDRDRARDDRDRDRDDRDRRDTLRRVSPAPAPADDPRRTPEQRPPEPRPDDRRTPLQPPPGPARPPKPEVDSHPAPRVPAPRPDSAPGRGPLTEPRRGPPANDPRPVGPLDIPPGHLPQPGECRIWIPGTPPGRQPHRASSECDRITREAPAGSWVVYRPTADRKVVHVRVVDARRPGVLVTTRVFDAVSLQFLREEQP